YPPAQIDHVQSRRIDIDAVDVNRAPANARAVHEIVHSINATQQGRLAAAGRSNERCHRARRHLQGDIVEDFVIAVSEIDFSHVDHYLMFLRVVCCRFERFRWGLWPNCLWRFHHGYHDNRLLCLSRSTMEANAISITTTRKTNAVPY